MWGELEVVQPMEEFEALVEWILDPQRTRAHMAMYKKYVATFWVMKIMLARVLMV